jgi:hypothetical protein
MAASSALYSAELGTAAMRTVFTPALPLLLLPGDSHVLSGDKKGQVAIWNFMQVGATALF